MANEMSADQEKFFTLILANKKIIYKICHAYCQDPEDRKDLAQEIIIQLWKSADRYDSNYQLSTWIYRIALNVAISFQRSESRRKKHFSGSATLFPDIFEQQTASPATDENITLLYRFIDKMDALNKALILLYLDNLSYREIATILGISESNVGTKLGRLKQQLKAQFANLHN